MIPYDNWQPLTVPEVTTLFTDAPFQWAFAGGYAVEQFLGRSIRAHDDIDVLVFRDEQLSLQKWLDGWALYAADPPGTLREWRMGESLPVGIHDIWGHRDGVGAWQLQLMLAEVEGDEWVYRRDPTIRGSRDSLMTQYNGLPCIRVEVQLLYKAKGRRPKDEQDFEACLAVMRDESKAWLKEKLQPEHPWVGRLCR